MKTYQVGIIGATGMVGQRFATLLENHPWFHVAALAASARSAGKTYREAVGDHWLMTTPMPASMADMVIYNASEDVEKVASLCDFVFCAVNMKKEEIKALEEAYAKAECPVMSNNSANRGTPDVPMIIPEINADHAAVIEAQRKRLGTKRGFISVKSNCSLQSYVPAVHPLLDLGVTKVLACTYQAISGAGKTFATWPESVDNVIPYIGGEEEKSEQEPLKIWGHVENGVIVNAASPPSRHSACACPFPTATPRRSLSPMKRKWRWKRSLSAGNPTRAPRRSSVCPARRSSSCTISVKMTARRAASTATWRTAWLFPSAACVRTRSTPSSSCASPTTRCAARPAARCSCRTALREGVPGLIVFWREPNYHETTTFHRLGHGARDAVSRRWFRGHGSLCTPA